MTAVQPVAGAAGAGAVVDAATMTISVKAAPYSAKGDGIYVTDAAITTGTALLSSASASFTSADNGKKVLVAGAGTSTAVGTTSAGLTTGAPITTIAVNALGGALAAGNISIVSGTNQQTFATSGAAGGATSIPVASTTPNFAYPSSSAITTSNDSLSTSISSVSGGVATLAANASSTVKAARAVYGTDDTAAIQSAIDAIGTNARGCVVFPDGVYIIAGALKSAATSGDNLGLNYRSQLALPAQDINATPKTTIVLEGAAPAGGEGTLKNGIQSKGAILQSTLIGLTASGVGNFPSVIGGPVDTSAGLGDVSGISNIHAEIRNLTVRCPSDPSITAINLQKCQTARVRGVVCDTLEPTSGYSPPPYAARPTHPSGQGLLMPMNFCQSGDAAQVFINGFYAGLGTGEHTIADYVFVFSCWMGLSVIPSYHANRLGYIDIEQCPYVIGYADAAAGVTSLLAGGPNPRLEIDCLDIEDKEAGGFPAWTLPVNHINDSTNRLFGAINFHRVLAITGVITGALTRVGGGKILFYQQGVPQFNQVRVVTTGAHTITSATWTALTWDTDSNTGLNAYDIPGAMWAAGSPTLISIPKDGLYLIQACVEYTAAAGGVARALRLTGTGGTIYSAQQVAPNATTHIPLNVSELIRCSAGDTFAVEGYQDSGGALQWNQNNSARAHLTVAQIGF